MKISREDLKSLMKNKLIKAGLKEEHAETTAEILTWSHERGYFSHGAVRVEYYSERIAKGGITVDPKFTFKQTGPCSMLMDGDNGVGYEVAKVGMEKAIEMANKKDMILICGKGHELTQEINGEKYPFDEREIVKEILNN